MLTIIQPVRRTQPLSGWPVFSLSATAPIVVLSVSIDPSGLQTTVVYSRVAVVLDAIGYALSGITGATLSSPTGSGTDDTWVFTNSRAALRGEAPVLDYSGTGTSDTDDNLLTPFTGHPITNLSDVLPVPTGLQAQAGDGWVALAWNAIDPSQDGVRIDRSTDGTAFDVLFDKSTDGVTYTDNAAVNGTAYWYRIKTFVNSPALESNPSNVAGPVTPTSTTAAEGYYAKRAKMRRKAGAINLGIYSQLDNSATAEDQGVLQEAMDEADRYVDVRARVKRLTAESGTTNWHMFLTGNVYFERISDLASAIAVAEVYRARGFTGDANNQAEGQMADMDKRAKAELDEIFESVLFDQTSTAATADGSVGMQVIHANPCVPCPPRWRRW